jgi:hypothetical protein
VTCISIALNSSISGLMWPILFSSKTAMTSSFFVLSRWPNLARVTFTNLGNRSLLIHAANEEFDLGQMLRFSKYFRRKKMEQKISDFDSNTAVTA